jgi:hypothetical protein
LATVVRGHAAPLARAKKRSARVLFHPPPRARPGDDAVVRHQVILLHPDAPAKPAPGAACNGCGLCCAAEPCPIGVLVSRRTRGACAALVWRGEAGAYRCGLVEQPAAHLPPRLAWAAPLLRRLARRFIAAGIGCDCSFEPAR